MKFSIIVPVYNAEKYLSRCIESLINQNVDKEILLINNNSSDNSKAICLDYSKKYDFIKLFDCTKQGTSCARNVGLENVTGDIICFCDNDDYYEYNSLEKIDDYFLKNSSVNLIISNFYTVEKGTKISHITKKNINTSNNRLYDIFSNEHGASIWNKFYRKDILLDLFFNEDTFRSEDIYFNSKVLTSNKNINVLPIDVFTYNYVLHGKNYSKIKETIFNNNNIPNEISCLCKIQEDCLLNESENKYINFLKVHVAIDELSLIDSLEEFDIIDRIIKKNIKDFVFYHDDNLFIFKISKIIKYYLLKCRVLLFNL